ncbi:uncharacterized protein LOC110763143 [Prunus avium]|uniref:Uncharacterized protein LOC110763143 n=1 Tax=Prunus avium TaxID=42229 RepID=A0A6P5T3Q8_PRUAV|nr:uncharacterized protein LOC110763143 [Prunus avium]
MEAVNSGRKRESEVAVVDVGSEEVTVVISDVGERERENRKEERRVRVVGPSIALKYLTIKWCKLESIEIRDVKLVSFIYEGKATNLLLNNVPFLVEVSVSERLVRIFSDEVHVYRKSIELPFTQLSCCLSQLEIFVLDIDLAVYNQDYVFPVLANVKHLELTVKANYDMDLFHLTSFMKASPLVQRLVLKLNFTTLAGMGPIKSAGECPHHYLKVLEIVGYRAHTCVVQHVMHLIKSAVALEKIIVHPVQRLNESYVRVREVEKVEEAKARDHAMQCLREKVPATIEFVCL